MTRTLAPILAALALSGCASSDRLSGGVTNNMATQMLHHTEPTFRLPHRGGYVNAARGIANMANMRMQTLVIDGPLVSSSVLAARMTARVEVVDPDAPWMGLHLAHRGGVVDMAESRRMFEDMRAPGCMDWYLRQPEARGNRIAYVSWNFMERDCK
jgi:hypothetical protein